MQSWSAWLGFLLAAGCGGATRGASAVADQAGDADAGAGGSRAIDVDASAGDAPRVDAGVPPGAGGSLTCAPGTTFWYVDSFGAAQDVPLAEGPGCFVPCEGDVTCPEGTLCADVPGCVCADPSACEACYSEWLCVEASGFSCRILADYARRTVRASPQRGCVTDTDCVQASLDTDCSASCPVAVGADALNSIASAVEQANQKWCRAASARSCSPETVDCGVAGAPVCVDGTCQLAAASDAYGFDVVNPIDSGDSVLLTKSDFALDACIAMELFVTSGDPEPRFVRALARHGWGNCCPADVAASLPQCDATASPPCEWFAASPAPQGAARIDASYRLTAHYGIYFPVLQSTAEIDVTDLPAGQCPSPP